MPEALLSVRLYKYMPALSPPHSHTPQEPFLVLQPEESKGSLLLSHAFSPFHTHLTQFLSEQWALQQAHSGQTAHCDGLAQAQVLCNSPVYTVSTFLHNPLLSSSIVSQSFATDTGKKLFMLVVEIPSNHNLHAAAISSKHGEPSVSNLLD